MRRGGKRRESRKVGKKESKKGGITEKNKRKRWQV